MRLEHALSQARVNGTQTPVQQCAAFIEAGRVSVAGVVVLEPSHQVLIGAEEVALDGAPIDATSIFHSLLLFHKPSGTVCKHGAENSIFHCLTAEQQHPDLSFFGRLDRGTTGLMLLGTDGGLGHMLTNPDCHIAKEYWALLTGVVPLRADARQAMADGLVLADGTICRPAALDPGPWDNTGPAGALRAAEAVNREIPGHPAAMRASGARSQRDLGAAVATANAASCVPEEGGETSAEQPCVRMTLHEGCFHQVKRMLGACNGNVVGLHREAVGPLRLSDLDIPVGMARSPTAAELQLILTLLPASCRVAKVHKVQRSRPRRLAPDLCSKHDAALVPNPKAGTRIPSPDDGSMAPRQRAPRQRAPKDPAPVRT